MCAQNRTSTSVHYSRAHSRNVFKLNNFDFIMMHNFEGRLGTRLKLLDSIHLFGHLWKTIMLHIHVPLYILIHVPLCILLCQRLNIDLIMKRVQCD